MPAALRAVAILEQRLHGVYDFSHPDGEFEVHLRSGGRFFAPKFPAKSFWTVTVDANNCGKLHIAWAKYGQYVLALDNNGSSPSFSGSLVDHPEAWRKVHA